MAKGKSQFTFPYSERSEQIIRDFLQANGFQYKEPKNAESYYSYKDGMCNGGLQYQVTGSGITVYFFLGKSKKPMVVDDSFVGSVAKQHYKNVLKPLFDALNNPEGFIGDTQLSGGANTQRPPEGSTYSKNMFEESTNKSREKFAIIAFVMSLIGLVLSCLGFTYGVALIIMEFYFAFLGIKTKKKGLASAAIVIAGVSILILIAEIILIAMGVAFYGL